jgi:hypothetical protein
MAIQVKTKKLHTTLGELITAIVDTAKTVTSDERGAYDLTGFVLNHILRPVPVIVANRKIRRRKV